VEQKGSSFPQDGLKLVVCFVGARVGEECSDHGGVEPRNGPVRSPLAACGR